MNSPVELAESGEVSCSCAGYSLLRRHVAENKPDVEKTRVKAFQAIEKKSKIDLDESTETVPLARSTWSDALANAARIKILSEEDTDRRLSENRKPTAEKLNFARVPDIFR